MLSLGIFDCPICYSHYDDNECKPCTFPCGHTCCLKHIYQMSVCHECRTVLPNRAELRVNIALRDASIASLGLPTHVAVDSLTTEIEPFIAENINLKIYQTPIRPISEPNPLANFTEYDEVELAVSVISPDSFNGWRCPTDMVIVIDVSGSMGDLAVTADAETANSQLSLLDIVKHAAKTIISSLNSNDRVSIISFSDVAKIEYPLNFMTESNKNTAISSVSQLQPNGSTNLWDGLLRSLELLKNRTLSGIQIAVGTVILLTDGVPTDTYTPPRGILHSLKKFAEKSGGHLPGIINTFGFGYNLESILLRNIAEEGNGMYSFIPDAGFVGTTFVNCLSNVLSNVATNVVLKIQHNPGVIIDYDNCKVVNNSINRFDWGLSYYIGTVQAGQNIDPILIKAYLPKVLNDYQQGGKCPILATLTWDKSVVRGVTESCVEIIDTISLIGDSQVLTQQEIACTKFRLNFISNLKSITTNTYIVEASRQNDILIGDIDEFLRSNQDEMLTITPSPLRVSPYESIKAIKEDLAGQIREAFSRNDWFKKWGRHYLPSISRAHQLQQCNNFKDPGIQHYGGELCSVIRDFSEDIFVKLPPPVPSRSYSSYPSYSSYRSSSIAPQPVNMSAYNNRNAGCFHEDCVITMQDGSLKKCKDIQRGDIISSGDSIDGIFITDLSNVGNKVPLVHYEDNTNRTNPLIITPYHPMKINGKWTFPIDLVNNEVDTHCTMLYSFVLKNRTSSIIVNSIECITLAHGIENDPVATHPFFGTEKIVQALKSYPNNNWTNHGTCTIPCDSFVRDETNLVIGFK